ncbi:UNVERIFIED_CONTAM: RNA-dependent RNA polymerase 2 [Sesamum radiatum]|uniref:RNA-dependent RNA polymerase 2 n=1 Tax=Sesamum radiatum TaxID=300843 RepID=A0AAW2PIE3_SESRA
MDMARPTLTVKVSNIPQTAIAQELLSFLESTLGKGTVFAIEIFTAQELEVQRPWPCAVRQPRSQDQSFITV